MTGKMLFYYFGDDEAYYRALLGEFNTNTKLPLEFTRIFKRDEKTIQSLALKVFSDSPSCIFIDFSKHSQDYLHLARIIARTPLEHKMITVGLVDYLSPPEILQESMVTGVSLTHIKSAETFDVVYDVVKLLAPKEIGEHGFATAKLNETWEAAVPVKVGYVHRTGLHFESDLSLGTGSRVLLNHHWLKNKIVPSREMVIRKVTKNNLFYQFQHAIDADFLFVDEFHPPEGLESHEVASKSEERDHQVRTHKKLLLSWIADNQSRSFEKLAKVLIVDRKLKVYDNQQRTDMHPYTIRCIPYLDDLEAQVDRLQPQVLAFSLEKKGEDGARNTPDKLNQLMGTLRQFEKRPFVVLFNSEMDSSKAQEIYQYQQMMATDQELSVEVLLQMAEKITKKLGESGGSGTGNKVFLKKTNSDSIAEVVLPVTVLKLSESTISFLSPVELPEGLNLRLTSPVNMYIHVLPPKAQGAATEYVGLIHALGEREKKELRKFVNAVFFRDHDAQVNAEADEFKKLNETKLQEKQETIRLDLEVKAKALEEDNLDAASQEKIPEGSETPGS